MINPTPGRADRTRRTGTILSGLLLLSLGGAVLGSGVPSFGTTAAADGIVIPSVTGLVVPPATIVPATIVTPGAWGTPSPASTIPTNGSATSTPVATLPATHPPASPPPAPGGVRPPLPPATGGLTPTPTSGAGVPNATPANCLDSFESDGLPQEAKPLLLDQHQDHFLCPAGDADWLTFFANKGKAYQIATTDLSPGVDTYLYLFAADARTILAYNDEAPGKHAVSEIHFTPTADGWYFLMVKNQGDIGFAGAHYGLVLTLENLPAATSSPTAATATSTPASAPPTATATPPLWATPIGPAAAPPVAAAVTPGLLHILPGDSASAGLPVVEAGPVEALNPDWLEPNDDPATARAVDVGVVYRHLNFVAAGMDTDSDFYSWHAKPLDCYLVQTGEVSPGLDTTLLLWKDAARPEDRQLLAQNDDSHAHTADLSSAVRWCNPTSADLRLIAQVRNYAGAPTDTRGKTYSFATVINPPTPMPTATPRPTTPIAAGTTGNGSAANTGTKGNAVYGGTGTGNTSRPPGDSAPAVIPTTPPPPALATVPASLPAGTPTPTMSATPTASLTATLTVTPTLTPTATPTPATVTVDVVVYFGARGTGYSSSNQASAPDPGSGIAGLLVQLVDRNTNHPIDRLNTLTDAYGHARLQWTWQGPVAVTVPQLLQTQVIAERDLGLTATGQLATVGGGHLYVPIRIQPYTVPIIHP